MATTIRETSSDETVLLTSYTDAGGVHTLSIQLSSCGAAFQLGDAGGDGDSLSLVLSSSDATLTLSFATDASTWPSGYAVTVSKSSDGSQHQLPHTFDRVSPEKDFHVTITPTTGAFVDAPIGWDPKIKVVAPSRGSG